MKRKSTGWIVIHMAHGRAKAEEIEQRLTQEGYWVRSQALKTGSADDQLFEILALPSEARAAQRLIMRMGL